jgi:hypothetical protein
MEKCVDLAKSEKSETNVSTARKKGLDDFGMFVMRRKYLDYKLTKEIATLRKLLFVKKVKVSL